MGRSDRAANLYALALERDPDNWFIRLQLASCLANSRQPRAAARQYLVLARRYVERGFLNDALELGRWILELDPCEFSHANIADIALAIGSPAVSLCRRASHVHREAGRNSYAADLLLLCGRLDPNDIEPWQDLGQLYFEHEMRSEAAWALRQAGMLLLEAGDHRRFVDFAYTILWLEPDNLDTRHELSRVLVKMGQSHEAAVEHGESVKAVKAVEHVESVEAIAAVEQTEHEDSLRVVELRPVKSPPEPELWFVDLVAS
ncbi:MAG: hypothetical protein AAGF11_20195 [Myxococcota bacterium]